MKAAVESLEEAQWKETQEKAKEMISSTVGPFGEVVRSPTEGEASPKHQPLERKKSKSKKKKGKKRVNSSSGGSDSVPVVPETVAAVDTGKL